MAKEPPSLVLSAMFIRGGSWMLPGNEALGAVVEGTSEALLSPFLPAPSISPLLFSSLRCPHGTQSDWLVYRQVSALPLPLVNS